MPRVSIEPLAAGCLKLGELRQAEVEYLYASVPSQKEVLRLEIAMGDSLLVSGSQSAGHRDRNVDGFASPHRTLAKPIAKGFALKQLADDIGRAAVLADMQDGKDVGMVQGGGSLGFQLETTKTIWISGISSGEDLDCYLTF